MPTKFERIPVTNDPELSAALERVRALMPEAVKTATLVHDLALRGAGALLAEEDRRREGIEHLIAVSTSAHPPFDRDVLARIDEEAWRLSPDER